MIFYPEQPKNPSRVMRYLDLMDSRNVIYWSYKVKTSMSEGLKCNINRGCWDVSKEKVQRVFHKTFGYRLSVDPRTHKGTCIEKGMGHTHSGRILRCPVQPKEGKVYEKLIDARVSPNEVSELRVFWCLGQYFVIEKIKSNMFGHSANDVILRESGVFDDIEEKRIADFCQEFGMDFGELDILRDSDGLIYVIDVNNVPGEGGIFNERAEELYKNQVRCISKY